MGTFRQVADQPGGEAGFLRHEALMALARLHELQGNVDQSIAMLREVLKENHVPRTNPESIDNPNRALVQRIRSREEILTYAGLARLELIRHGVDVEAEFPLFVEPVAEDS